ncbi:MAG: hypothetical protein H7Y16_01395 [Candidatus Parcubacteria bacterium]|nr:hypothetical protein [Burkholderiales bacterium]
MRFKVYLMRHQGRRRPWDEIKRGECFVGTLLSSRCLYGGESFESISLQSSGGRVGGIPDLFQPVLDGFAPNAFRLRGFERIDDPRGAYGVVQEWHCEPPDA